jgi:D-psicose/D-tagatose/L-ribulose 3-epimerase
MKKRRLSRRNLFGAGAMAFGAAGLVAGPRSAGAEKSGMNVRFGLNLLVYTATFSKDQIDLIPKAAEMGFDGVEIPFNNLDILDPKATRKARESAGMGLTACVVLMPGTSITSTDAEERRVGVERLKRTVDITAEMGGGMVAGPLYAPVRELTGRARTEDEWRWAAEGLRACAEHAGQAGLAMAIEPLNRFETHVINTAADALRLVKEVGHPSLKVQIDTFHANIEEKDTICLHIGKCIQLWNFVAVSLV